MIHQNGPTSVGRDVGAIAGTTAPRRRDRRGCPVGERAQRSAQAQARRRESSASCSPRGHPTVIYPESVLTFRIEQPVNFSTERAPQAFQYVSNQDYGQPASQGPPPRIAAGPVPGGYPVGAYPPPAYGYGYPAPYPAYGYPYYGYPGFSVFVGPRFYYGRGFYGGYRYHR